MRWLLPPPQRTAYFSSTRRPGVVLRVSTSCTPEPCSWLARAAVAVAMPESRIARLRAVRSAPTKAAAGPSSSSRRVPALMASPSFTSTCAVTPESIRPNTAAASCPPQNTPSALLSQWAWPRQPCSAAALRSPRPRSSCSQACKCCCSAGVIARGGIATAGAGQINPMMGRDQAGAWRHSNQDLVWSGGQVISMASWP